MQLIPLFAAIETSTVILIVAILAIAAVLWALVRGLHGTAIIAPPPAVIVPPPGITFRTLVVLAVIAVLAFIAAGWALSKRTDDGDARVEASITTVKNGYSDEIKKLDTKIDRVGNRLEAAIGDIKTNAATELHKLDVRLSTLGGTVDEINNQLEGAEKYARENTRTVGDLAKRVDSIQTSNAEFATAVKEGFGAVQKNFADTLAEIKANSLEQNERQKDLATSLSAAIADHSARSLQSQSEATRAIKDAAEAIKSLSRSAVSTPPPAEPTKPAPAPAEMLKPAPAKPAHASPKARTGGEATSGTYLEPAKGVTIKSPGGLFKPAKGEHSLDVTYEVEWKAPKPVPTARANEIIGKAVAQFQQFELAKFAFDDYEREERENATAKLEKLVSAFVRSCDDREALEGLTVADVTLRMTRPVKVR